MNIKQKVAIGFLGPVLDMGKTQKRWERWRPSVALCQQPDLPLDRFDILFQKPFANLLKRIQEDIHSVSPETRVHTHALEIENPWDFEEVYGVLHDFAKTYPFDTEKEDYLIHITTGTHVAQICLFLLTESHYFPGRLIQTRPGKKSDPDVAGHYSVIDLDLSRYDQIAMRFQKEKQDDISFLKSGIETKNKAFNTLIERIELVALNSVDPILLMGPTGAGKSRLARRIYDLKKVRRQIKGEFVEVNCATLRGDAAMSALFGHKKGAFTGALADRQGLLRTADQGMIFLDEVGELGLDEQSMLLRAIEEKRFLPMGSDKESSSDFQLICGTNHDLSSDVTQLCFREDLLSRINLWTFHLPGLCQRSEDIEPNLGYELEKFAQRTRTSVTFSREAREKFLAFAISPQAVWSANFRDLNAAVTRMATLSPGGRITTEIVNEEIQRLKTAWHAIQADDSYGFLKSAIGEDACLAIDLFDQVQLSQVIRICRESKNLSEAGRKLFSVSRLSKKQPNDADRLRKYLAKFNLTWEMIQTQNEG